MWTWWWMFPLMGVVMVMLCVGMMFLCKTHGCRFMHSDRQSRSSTPATSAAKSRDPGTG
jgi:uncharacterized membrane protein